MTRQEAIRRIKDHMDIHRMYEPEGTKISEALEMAVKSLEKLVLLELEVKTVWIVTYWDFDQEPVVTPFNNRENAEKCWAYFKEIYDGCCLDECEVFSKFSTPDKD